MNTGRPYRPGIQLQYELHLKQVILMISAKSLRSFRLAALLSIASLSSQVANATVVEFQTVLGNFEVNLYDNATPETVANFLNYVNNGAYTSSVIHRSVPGFVVQGGGFTYDLGLPLDGVPANPPVVNEPVFANVRGTIAMAKLGGDPNSATSEWFFNLADNTANLDGQNGGFTAFGEVVGDGMAIVDAIAALPRFNFGGATTDLPLRDYSVDDLNNAIEPDENNLVIINAVIVSDSTVDSAAGLSPPLSTNVTPPPTTQPAASGGGGSLGVISLLGLLLRRRRRLFR
jgi:peptidyl-prolyl cis-trans isomerase A (cyclophilin A)